MELDSDTLLCPPSLLEQVEERVPATPEAVSIEVKREAPTTTRKRVHISSGFEGPTEAMTNEIKRKAPTTTRKRVHISSGFEGTPEATTIALQDVKRKAAPPTTRKRVHISSGYEGTGSSVRFEEDNPTTKRRQLLATGRSTASIVVEERTGPDTTTEEADSELGHTVRPSASHGLKSGTEPIWSRILVLRASTRYVARFLTKTVRFGPSQQIVYVLITHISRYHTTSRCNPSTRGPDAIPQTKGSHYTGQVPSVRLSLAISSLCTLHWLRPELCGQ